MSEPTPKTLAQLINAADPGWPIVMESIRQATKPIEIVPVNRQRAESTLVALQVTTRSPLGALALETGGMLIDHGWVRLLGGGAAGMDGDLARWNGLGTNPLRPMIPGVLIVAYDVLGGFYAINGGAIDRSSRNVFYFAPDSLQWEDLERGYGDFVNFLCIGDLERFYANYRWPSWKRDVATLTFDQVFSFYPPLWTKEGKQLDAQNRAPVPALEAFGLQLEIAAKLRDVPEGAQVRIDVAGDADN